MRYGNCLIFVIKKVVSSGGYIIIRRSRYTWIPHFLWARSLDGIEVEDFQPMRPVTNRFLRWFPIHTLIFRGRIRRGPGDPP